MECTLVKKRRNWAFSFTWITKFCSSFPFLVGGTPLSPNWLWTQFKKVHWWVEQQVQVKFLSHKLSDLVLLVDLDRTTCIIIYLIDRHEWAIWSYGRVCRGRFACSGRGGGGAVALKKEHKITYTYSMHNSQVYDWKLLGSPGLCRIWHRAIRAICGWRGVFAALYGVRSYYHLKVNTGIKTGSFSTFAFAKLKVFSPKLCPQSSNLF